MNKFLIVFCLLFCISCNKSNFIQLSFINPDGTKSAVFNLEVVKDLASRQQGLMYRKEMPDDQGMLFVFPEEKNQAFWMKNTFLSLDIIFLNHNLEVVHIIDKTIPLSEDSLSSNLPCLYVIELKAGNAKKNNITKISKILTNSPLPKALE